MVEVFTSKPHSDPFLSSQFHLLSCRSAVDVCLPIQTHTKSFRTVHRSLLFNAIQRRVALEILVCLLPISDRSHRLRKHHFEMKTFALSSGFISRTFKLNELHSFPSIRLRLSRIRVKNETKPFSASNEAVGLFLLLRFWFLLLNARL